VNEPGQARGDRASSRIDPDHAERLTGIYGLEVHSCIWKTIERSKITFISQLNPAGSGGYVTAMMQGLSA
jgi:hypothetical protein